MSFLSLLKQPGIRWAAGGWSFFIAENALLSENRTWLIEQLGDESYHLMYGTLSTIATASIGYAYYSIRKGTSSSSSSPLSLTLKNPSPMAAVGGWICLSIGTIMLSQTAPKLQIPFALVDTSAGRAATSTATTSPSPTTQDPPPSLLSSKTLQVRCPFDFSDKQTDKDLHGMERITRHPGLWSLGFLGLGQAMLLAGNTPLQIWWCGPAAVAWLGGSHTDSRFRRGMGGTMSPDYESRTSNIPFWAIVCGKQGSRSWQGLMEDIKPLNAFVALGATSLWVLRRIPR